MAKLRVLVLFGGKSAEHEVSILSARNVYQALDKKKYDVSLVGIDRNGVWYQTDPRLLLSQDPVRLSLSQEGHPVAMESGIESTALVQTTGKRDSHPVDVVFPILHGPMGEDGTIQGMMKVLGLPFVGPGVLGSAVGMDKDVMKRLLRDAGIPIARFQTVRAGQENQINTGAVIKELGLPLFVKPANMGSSVGVTKVKSESELLGAIQNGLQFDTKVLIEEAIVGREIECSVLGNQNPKASLPGEVINNSEFYSYEAKYLDPEAARTEIPAKLTSKQVQKCQDLAIATFQALECEGMGRVDFFLRGEEFLVNEINTIPGFTKISMYPKMWEASGLPYSSLLDELIQLALQRHQKESKLKIKPEIKGGGFKA